MFLQKCRKLIAISQEKFRVDKNTPIRPIFIFSSGVKCWMRTGAAGMYRPDLLRDAQIL